MEISCTFATSMDTPDHIALAEQLGFRRAWCYDSPALYPDVWMTLARAAERTQHIGLGPAVLVPSLRHVMTNAAAVATLAALAPGRVSIAVSSGFTGRVALGQRPLPWARVRAYVVALRGLLRGAEVEWDGAPIRMLHLEGYGATRPIDVPILIGATGPKGLAVAEELGNGLFLTSAPATIDHSRFAWVAQTVNGTVLDDGEAPNSPRAFAAAGHAAALVYHSAYEQGTLDRLPDGTEYARRLEAVPPRLRHLTLHEGHLVTLNAIDRGFITPDVVARLGRAASVDAWRARLAQQAQAGVTECVYQPAGPDIPRELRAFAAMAGVQPRPAAERVGRPSGGSDV